VGVGTVVRGYLVCPEVQPLHDPIPHRRVIHSALPRVADIDQSLILWIPLTVEVVVPRFQFEVGVMEKIFRLCFIPGMTVDAKCSRCMHRRLDYPGGLAVFRSLGAFSGVPEVRPWKVVREAGVEDQLG
jgi:hypothetical protein